MKYFLPPALQSSRGSGMVMSLIAMAVLALLAMAVYRTARTQVRESVYQKRLAQAHAIAEAGLEDAMREIYLSPGWKLGFKNKPFAGGKYTVTVSTESSPWITSTGYSVPIALFGPAVKTVRAKVHIDWSASSSCGSQANSAYQLNGFIDAYDSALNLSPASFLFGANICVNAQVSVIDGLGLRLRGNAEYLTGTPPPASAVEGTVVQSTTTRTLPSHDGASYVSANNNTAGITPPGVYNPITNSLSVSLGQVATLTGGTYYLNSLNVDGALNIDPSLGPVIIYLAGPMKVSPTGAINNLSLNPSQLAIYGQNAASSITLQSLAPLHAVIESPKAQISVSQTVFGNLIGDSVLINQTGLFHYDKQLGGAQKPLHVSWEPASWSASYKRQ